MTHNEEGTEVLSSSKDSVKIVIQSIIVLLLGWVGVSINQLQKDTVVVQSQLADLKVAMANIPGMQRDIAVNREAIIRMQSDIDELRTLKGAK